MIDELIKSMGNSIALHTEELVRNAICHQTGDAWPPSDLTKRGSYRVFPNGSKTFLFDGVELIHFFPIKSKVETKDSTITLKTTQSYKLLYKKGE